MRNRIINLLFPRWYRKHKLLSYHINLWCDADCIELPTIIDSALDNKRYFVELYKLTRIPEEYWK